MEPEILSHPSFPARYLKLGHGEPVVLVHGFAETYEILLPLAEALSKKYLVILPLLPQCGNDIELKGDFTLANCANYIHEILLHEKIDLAIIIGHSMGGYIAMEMAHLFSEKMSGLCLLHSTAFADSEEKKQVRKDAQIFIKEHGREPFVNTLLPKLYYDNTRHKNEYHKHKKMAMQYSEEQIINCYEAMMNRNDNSHLLGKLNFPIQLIAGENDQSIPIKDVLSQASVISCCFLTIFSNCGHTSMHEFPSLLEKSIFNYLATVSSKILS